MSQPGGSRRISARAGSGPRSPAAAGMAPTEAASVWTTLVSRASGGTPLRRAAKERRAKPRMEAVMEPESHQPVLRPM